MAALDEAGLALRGSALFEKMRARTEAASETFEAEWTEREAQRAADERTERIARLMEQCGWAEEWDKSSDSIYYHCSLTGETRWEAPTEAELEHQLGQSSSGGDPGPLRGSGRDLLAGFYWQSEGGEVQGPRSVEEMREWYAWGYFAPGTLVREVNEEQFVDIMTRPEIVEDAAAQPEPEARAEPEARPEAQTQLVTKQPEPEPEPEPETKPAAASEAASSTTSEPKRQPEPTPQPAAAAPDSGSSKPSSAGGWLPILVCLVAVSGGVLAMMLSTQPLTTTELLERHQGAVA